MSDLTHGAAVTTPPRTISRLNFCPGAVGVGDGYGNSAEQIALALERLGIQVHLAGIIPKIGHLNAPEIYDRYAKGQSQYCECIIFYNLPTSWCKQNGRPGYGFSMFECSELPPSWLPGLGNVKTIFVPSSWNQEIFERAARPFGTPVKVVPLGVDASAFIYKERRRQEGLRFLHFATVGTEYRKGADVAVAAFRKAFPESRRDVELELRSRTMPYAGDLFGDARIRAVQGLTTTAELVEIYHSFDALLYTSRGEGFGLIPLEAMATGLPTIYTGETGTRDYRQFGLTVGATEVPARIGQGRLSWIHEQGAWMEPNVDEIAERMQELDTEYKRIQAKAARDAKAIAHKFTWDRTARILQAHLEGWPVSE